MLNIFLIFTVYLISGLNYGKSFSLNTHPGDIVTFSCTCPQGHENDLKIVYRVTNQSIDSIIYTYTEHEEKDRYELHVSSKDTKDRLINMSISNVMVDDGGLYLSGVSKDMLSYKQIFCEMQLHVTEDLTINIPPPGSSVISITLYIGVALLLIAGLVFFYKMWSIKTKGASSPASRGNPVNREKPQTPMAPNPAGRTGTSSPNTADQEFYSMVQFSKK
ncbi:uncharacterized protein LOC131346520 isoform X3 [Hemibagrus wyckioides]|uniref:uncharacterized protein LOC131346520 isoform X3 n=1 Tax=Hemibagrus wyckioides TaxID=337641 RepID=UPI00266BA70F|nr:uncharacterized protein LOC131346520 isoform X3 [Hemibagrus wyckioides]